MTTFRIRSLAVLFFAIACTGLGNVATHPPTAGDGSHPPVQIRKEAIHVGVGKEARQIEDVTDHCLECHGPGTDTEESDSIAPRPAHSVGGSERSHPVKVAYPEAENGLTPREALDERLLLIEGRMTCVTCHDPEAPDHALVLPEQQSQLCLACHKR